MAVLPSRWSTPRAAADVEEHPPAGEAVGGDHHRVGERTGALHVGGGPTVVHLAPHEHVAQRVEVRDPHPVHLGADVVAARLVARDAVRVTGVAARQHVVVRGARGLGRRVTGKSWARLTVTPVRTSVPAAARRSGVRKLSAPCSSSSPTGPSCAAHRRARRAGRTSGDRRRSARSCAQRTAPVACPHADRPLPSRRPCRHRHRRRPGHRRRVRARVRRGRRRRRDRRPHRLAARGGGGAGPRCGAAVVVPADLSDVGAVEELVDAAVREFGRLDIVVNNVGGSMPMPFLDTSVDVRRRVPLQRDHRVPPDQGRAAPCCSTGGNGSVVNITSAMGRFRDRGYVAYGTAKAALAHMTRLLAADCAPKVRVNAVAPGSIATTALEIVLTDEPMQARWSRNTPLRRLGDRRRHRARRALPRVRRVHLRHRQDPRGRRRHRGLQPRHAPPRPLTHPRATSRGRRDHDGTVRRTAAGTPHAGARAARRGPRLRPCVAVRLGRGSTRTSGSGWRRLAEHTEIDLGTAVLVPNLRHVMTTVGHRDGGAHGARAPGVRVRHRGDRAGAEQARALVEDHPPLPRAAARAVAGRHRRRRR